MKRILYILILFLAVFAACEDAVVPKPKNLIKRKQMIKILVDVHLAESTYNRFKNDSIMANTTSADFYYSVLAKYNIADSVFEKSLIYYASVPKDFEKLYQKVMNNLSEMEQNYSGRKEQLLEFEEKEK